MIKRKWIIVVGLVLLIVAAGVLVRTLWTKPIEPGPTPDNFRRLYVLMETEEVEAILGKPEFAGYNSNGDRIGEWNKNRENKIYIVYQQGKLIYAIQYQHSSVEMEIPSQDTFFRRAQLFFGL